MASKTHRQIFKLLHRLATLAVITGGLAACAAPGGGTPTLAPTLQLTLLPGEPGSPAGQLAPDDRPLLENGPWLLLATALDGRTVDGAWLLNPDGSGLTPLLTGATIAGPFAFQRAVSPTGRQIALVTADDLLWHNLTLQVIDLPGGEQRIAIPLTSAETEPPSDAHSLTEPVYQPLQAVGGQDWSLAWSADGESLAFIGAHGGPSADLYRYTLADNTVTRLTDLPAQMMRPRWSPDGTHLLVYGYESVMLDRFTLTGAWLAGADGSGVTALYDPSGSDEEQFVAWLDEGEFLVYSRDIDCGWHDLRIENAAGGDPRPLWPGYFNKVALDPASGTLLIAVDGYTADCNTPAEAGLFRLAVDDPAPVRIAEIEASELAWSAGQFYAVTREAVYRVSSQVEVEPLDAPLPFAPLISPDGHYWAWAGQSPKFTGGLWLGTFDEPPTLVYESAIQTVSWTPDGEGMFFVADNALYRVTLSTEDTAPQLITPGVVLRDARGAAWAVPGIDAAGYWIPKIKY